MTTSLEAETHSGVEPALITTPDRRPGLLFVARDANDPENKLEVRDPNLTPDSVTEDFLVLVNDPRYRDLVKPGFYVHPKTGKAYKVTGIVHKFSESTDELYVLYQAQYHSDEFGTNCHWFRSVEDFTAKVRIPVRKSGKVKFEIAKRFEYRGF